jgi:CubicO group peptidase (beta-lactamase class C family)
MIKGFVSTLVLHLFLCLALLGQTPNKQKQIDQLIQTYVNYHLFNGNVLVAQKDKVVFQKSYGLANKEWNIPHTAETKFRIGSLTKQFTAMLILQLKQEGKINLQGRITDYLPWYQKDPGDKITLHQLLTHSSGLPNYTTTEAVNDINIHNYSPEEIAKKYCVGKPEFEPGTKYKYCNSGYFLLGVIIETITKKPYAQVLKERILDPAGMKNTGMDTPEQIVVNRAYGYTFSFDGYANTDYINPATATYSAGGMYSTVADLYLWEKGLYGNKLLSGENTDTMLTPNLGKAGYGIFINKIKSPDSGRMTTIMGHDGSISGFSSSMLRYAEDDIIVILLDNTRAEKRRNLENIIGGIVDILQGHPTAAPPQSMQVAMIEKLKTSGGEQLIRFYQKIKNEKNNYDLSGAESFLNNLGYYLIQKDRVKDALAVLKFATEEYPSSSNTFDTYGEALMKEGLKELAIKNYKRSIELDPKNENAVKQLKILESEH